MRFSIPYLYLALFSPVASVQGTSTADCIDSSLVAVLDGTLPVDTITCSQLSSFNLAETQLSGVCNGQSLNEHCPVTCMSCVNVCDDSNAIFELNGEQETCTSVAEDITKCNIFGVTETCRGTCEYCPTAAPSFSSTSPSSSPSNVPSLVLKVEELESRLNEQESSQTEVESRLNEQESSIATVCNELAGYRYIVGYGCLPYTSRNGEEMVYIKNTSAKNWEEHQESAISCSGKLADIFDENENEQVYSLLNSGQGGEMYIGGYQEQPCANEPSGCWTWSDGTEFTYTNWESGEPNDCRAEEHCLEMRADYPLEWNDQVCSYDLPAAYILPTTFNVVSDCNIITDF